MDKHELCQTAATALTYGGAILTVIMGFFSAYATAIGAICVSITCAANIYFNSRRIQILENQKDPIDDSF